MIIKRVVINILLAFIFFPLFMIGFESLQFLGYITIAPNRGFSGVSLSDHLRRFIGSSPKFAFFIFPLFGLLLFLVPYNWILMARYLKKGRYLTLLQKYFLFYITGIVVLIVVLALRLGIGVLFYPKILLFLIYLFIFSILFVTPLHFLVDEKDNRQTNK